MQSFITQGTQAAQKKNKQSPPTAIQVPVPFSYLTKVLTVLLQVLQTNTYDFDEDGFYYKNCAVCPTYTG